MGDLRGDSKFGRPVLISNEGVPFAEMNGEARSRGRCGFIHPYCEPVSCDLEPNHSGQHHYRNSWGDFYWK